MTKKIIFILGALLLVVACQKKGYVTSEEEAKLLENQPNDAFANNVYFGDTHLHTNNSFDAGAFGNTLSPDVAYSYAKGETVTASMGLKTKLVRPLDFLVVADHSDNMGMIPDLYAGDKAILADPFGKKMYDGLMAGKNSEVALSLIKRFSQGTLPSALNYLPTGPTGPKYKATWDRIIDSAEKNNDPGTFTAMIGYEWTSLIKGANMHRVVIYKDGADKARQIVPFTATPPLGSINPRDLWKWMANYEEKTGGNVLAIAHNGNLSNGIMFPLKAQYDGKRLDKTYVEERAKWEPLYEVTQMKGDGEAHPFLSPNDEFADFENWDFGNLDLSKVKKNSMLAGEYGREGLKRGLKLEKKFGTNPYKFGLIGATDSHTGLATTEADNFFGKMSTMEPGKKRLKKILMTGKSAKIYYRESVSSGLAAVWAKENTRESIFDAMKRKETYATTGQRLRVRLFAGWDFKEGDITRKDFVKYGYTNGVPMGGDLNKAKKGQSPKFLISAMKDPDSANLDRIQVVKGWMDRRGRLHERVYDAICSNGRKINSKGKCTKKVGNTVDVKTATYTNTIGETNLNVLWKDPKFKKSQKAFYYVRVLAIPTPRWTTYDAVRYGVKPPKDVPATIQDRAYTSPVWYNP
jgi:hypothetical protein